MLATSKAAADSVRHSTPWMRARILEELRKRPATDLELEGLTGLSGSSVRPGRGELAREGVIVPVGTRPTRSGRQATVWALTQTPSPVEDPAPDLPAIRTAAVVGLAKAREALG